MRHQAPKRSILFTIVPIFIAVGWVFTISLILASGYVVLFKPELIGQFGGRVLSGFEAAR